MLITTTEELKKYVAQMSGEKVIAVDTEFMREKTYYAKLCLIQIADEKGTPTLIDPLSIADMRPLAELMANPAIVKVFHAGGQDLEIFYQLLGVPVAPHFDTQAAAALLGYRDQLGYGALVQEELGVALSKADSFTDWSKRPLEESQLKYAADDVIYLAQMYPQIITKLTELGRLEWLDSELREREDAAYFQLDYGNLFRRVKKVSALSRRQLAVAREVAIWRELLAQKRNVPKKWICADETLIEIARRAPVTQEKVKSIRGVSPLVLKNTASLFEAIEKGKNTPEDELPEIKRRPKPVEDLESRVDLMMALVRARAKDNNIATTLLASRSDLERFAENSEGSPLLQGWRKNMIGNELAALLAGELTLRLEGGTLVVSPTKES